MAGASGGDAWRISGEDRMKHDTQFFQLKPVNGFITGEQAKGFFMQSGLPTAVLGQIWTLADMNNDGKMDKKEFSIAMHLIKKKLQGFELPKALPPSLKADPSPMTGGMGMAPPMGMSMVTGMPMMSGLAPTSMTASSMAMPIMSNGVPSQIGMMGTPPMGMPGMMPDNKGRAGSFGPGGMMADNKPRAGSFGQTQVPQQPTTGFSIPHNSKLKHTQTFNMHDRNKRGYLTGVEARALLVQTGLSQQLLAQIWNLADYDKDGNLTCEEFCIALHLADLVKAGVTIPAKLPPELYPAKVRAGSMTGTGPRTGSFTGTSPAHQPAQQKPDAFGDLLGGMGMQQPVPPQPNVPVENVVEDLQPVTFEDKRKENFDKGQAELERRRQMLQEQMRAEERARLEKERQEQEKRERIRQEQERKRLMELERQMEKQRQIEREKEQQRQKMLEQKEAARRESERHRQMEWERQRKEQLLAEKAREYQQLSNAKSKSSNLKCELESLRGKKAEIGQKINQVRMGVNDFTSSIESMRITRDNKNAEIERLQNEIQTLDQKFAKLKQDQEFLNVKVQTTIQSNPMAETYRTVLHSVELKKTTIQKLKKELEQIERDTESRLLEIDNTNSDLKNLKAKLEDIQKEISKADRQKQEIKIKINADAQAQREREEQERKRKEEAARIANLAKAAAQPAKPAQPVGTTTATNDSAWFAFGGSNQTTKKTDDIWSAAFSDVNVSSAGSQDIWGNAFSSQQTTDTSRDTQSRQKAKALYQFDARNHDELSLIPGDIVLLYADQSGAEPGWLGGEKNGKTGWFPEAYIEKLDSSQPVTDSFGGAVAVDTEYSTPTQVNELRITSPTPGQGEKAPDGLQAQALYPWKAKKDNHLTFNKGDVIVIKEQQDMWWSGELHGQIGWFPKSYVKLIGGVATNTSQSNSRSETPITGDQSRGTPQQVPITDDNVGQINTISHLTTDSSRSTPIQSGIDSSRSTPATLEQKEGECYLAVYSYQSSEPGDLNFTQNEVIMVTKKDGDWWTGTIGERSGIFPHNYVKAMDIPQAGEPSVESLLTANVSSIDLTTEGIDFNSSVGPTQTTFPMDQTLNQVHTQAETITSPSNATFAEDPFAKPNFELDPFVTSPGEQSNDLFDDGSANYETIFGSDVTTTQPTNINLIESLSTGNSDQLSTLSTSSGVGTSLDNFSGSDFSLASAQTNNSIEFDKDLFGNNSTIPAELSSGSSLWLMTEPGMLDTPLSTGQDITFADFENVFGQSTKTDSTSPGKGKSKPEKSPADKSKQKKGLLGLFKKKKKHRDSVSSETESVGSSDMIESPDSPFSPNSGFPIPGSQTGTDFVESPINRAENTSSFLGDNLFDPTSGDKSDFANFKAAESLNSEVKVVKKEQNSSGTDSGFFNQTDNLDEVSNLGVDNIPNEGFADFGVTNTTLQTQGIVPNADVGDIFDPGLYEEVIPKTSFKKEEELVGGDLYEDISEIVAARKEAEKQQVKPEVSLIKKTPPPRPPPPPPMRKKVRFQIDETPEINIAEIEKTALDGEEPIPPLPPQRRMRSNSKEVEQKGDNSPQEKEHVLGPSNVQKAVEEQTPPLPERKKKSKENKKEKKKESLKSECGPDKEEKHGTDDLKGKSKTKMAEKSKSMENLSGVEEGKNKTGKKSFWPWKKKADQSDSGKMSKSLENLDNPSMYEEPVSSKDKVNETAEVGNVYEPVKEETIQNALTENDIPHLTAESTSENMESTGFESNAEFELSGSYDIFLGVGSDEYPTMVVDSHTGNDDSSLPVYNTVTPEPDGTQTYEEFTNETISPVKSAQDNADKASGMSSQTSSTGSTTTVDGSLGIVNSSLLSTVPTIPTPNSALEIENVEFEPGLYETLGVEEVVGPNTRSSLTIDGNAVTPVSSISNTKLPIDTDWSAEDDNTYEEVGSPLRKKVEAEKILNSEKAVTGPEDGLVHSTFYVPDPAEEKTQQPVQPTQQTQSTLPSQPAQQKGSTIKKPEIASVIAAYSATGPEQLSLQPGQVIQVRKKSASGWWEGELQARGQKKKIGWFPANYVKLLGGSRNTPDNTQQKDQSLTPSPAVTVTGSTPSPSPQPQVNYIDQVIAVYPYAAQHDDELTFQKDSVINVISKDDDNWWKGEVNGQTGMFPANYVGPLTTSPPQDNTWSSDPVVLATTSAQESKRQNYIHELINTEETYMEDMSIVVEAFLNPMKDSRVLSEEEIEMVFVNWNELILCNTKLSRSLRVRKKMIGKGQVIHVIGDILCENLPHLTPYIRFCSCQLRAAALIQHKTENSAEFKEVHKRCMLNPKTKSMPLSSFLLKPMQRITKYPLMIQKIIQYTPEDHPDHQNLKEALTKAEELCSQVNEGVRERENSDKLEWMQGHINCEGLPEKLTFNSVTNCLGPRKVLYSGNLCKMKSNKELVGFLCNDFLLLTTSLSSSNSKFVFDSKAKSHHKMYKTPIFLNEIMVKRVGEEDSETSLFQVCHIDRVYNFKAANSSERESWVRHLSEASKYYIETERKKREKVHSFEEPNKKVGRMLVIIAEGINLASSQNVKRSAGVGRLLVVIQEGCDLQPRDVNGKSDPYCEVSMGAQEHKTKVIPATLNPKWNQNMQFTIRDVAQDVLCITVFDRDLFSPNDFLGRTEIRVKEILSESREKRGPITKRLLLHEISSGEVVVKLDLQLYEGLQE